MTSLSLLAAQASTILLPLAQEEESKAYPIPWLIVLLCVILGVLLAVRPDKREPEIKRDRKM